jgi:phosphate transport system permease protein
VAVLTTIGIVFSVVWETLVFFRSVSPVDFLFNTKWAPTGTPPSFGFLPLLAGTFLITFIAIIVAGPLGLLSAVYMAEYATPRLRSILKPVLEILAGIPTVVLGFFAALVVAPLIRGWGTSLGLDVASESALAAGLVMGMMIVPLISSLSDDIINAVPQSLRDGSYAMGATKSETIKRVVIPAALPGIVSAFMLAISRAVGETMIVVMAAGLAANLTANPLAAVTTITVQIATLLVGDQEFDSPKTLSAFALGFVLFFFTLVLNYIALRIVQKYREQYD